MRVQQNQTTFGINYKFANNFSTNVVKEGKPKEVLEVLERMKQKFPQDNRTFEINPGYVLIPSGKLGNSLIFTDGSATSLEKAIKRGVSSKKAIEVLPEYIKKFGKKNGVNVTLDNREMLSLDRINLKQLGKTLRFIIQTLSQNPEKANLKVKINKDIMRKDALGLEVSKKSNFAKGHIFPDENYWRGDEQIQINTNDIVDKLNDNIRVQKAENKQQGIVKRKETILNKKVDAFDEQLKSLIQTK